VQPPGKSLHATSSNWAKIKSCLAADIKATRTSRRTDAVVDVEKRFLMFVFTKMWSDVISWLEPTATNCIHRNDKNAHSKPNVTFIIRF